MVHRRVWRVSAFWLTFALLMSALIPITVSAARPTEPKLGLNDEELLAQARADGESPVTILVAA